MKDEFGVEFFEVLVREFWKCRKNLKDAKYEDFHASLDEGGAGGLNQDVVRRLNDATYDILAESWDDLGEIKTEKSLRSYLRGRLFHMAGCKE